MPKNHTSRTNSSREALLKYMGRRVTRLTKEIYGNQNRAFSHFALQLLYALDDDDAEAACGLGDAANGAVDAFWQDEESGRVVIVQAKYRAKANARFDRRSVIELASVWSLLNQPTQAPNAASHSNLAEPAAALAQARAENPALRIELVSVIAGALTLAASEQAEAFNKEHSSDAVELRLVDIEQLVEADLERRSLDAGPIARPIKLQLREYFEEPPQQGGVPTLVASINGQQLADIEHEYRFRIFQSNVRYQLPGKINENIDKTLKRAEGRRNFWYYNNGISIICDRYELNPNTKTVKVHNLQIVNGCQTTTTLSANAENLSDPSSAAIVLVRIIASESNELQRDITIYNNKQNAVKDRDLLSNDPHQERLQSEFAKLQPPWFYERKRGSWKAEVGSSKQRRQAFGGRIINNEKAAQSAYAFHHDPGEARARKRMLFVTRNDDPNGFYDLLFGGFTTPEWLLVPFLVNKYVAACKNDYVRQLRDLDDRPTATRSVAEKLLIQRSWIKFADQALVGTIAFYWGRRKKLSQSTLEALVESEVLEEQILSPSYALAVRDLAAFFASRVREYEERDETFVAANYLKGHWFEIREHLTNEEAYRASIGEDPLAGLPVIGRQ
jgi:hypothetical protein